MGAVGEALPFVIPALVSAAFDWYAVANGDKKLEYVTKPLTIVLLILGVLAMSATATIQCSDGPAGGGCERIDPHVAGRDFGLLLAALIFSLAGDVFLMLPRNLFVAGLASFLGAHVCYIIAFQPSAAGREPIVIGTLLVLLFFGAWFYTQLRRGMVKKGVARLIPAVLLYMIVISQMVASAVANNAETDFPQPQALIGAVGAGLFYMSDALIAWTRFVKELRWGPVAIHVTYHLAQIGLVLSFVR
jgi:uncharacterized membrane protein YhhN